MTAASSNDHDLLIEIKTMLSAQLTADADKEKRIRALEQRPVGITPRQMWTGVVSCVATFAAIATVMAFLLAQLDHRYRG